MMDSLQYNDDFPQHSRVCGSGLESWSVGVFHGVEYLNNGGRGQQTQYQFEASHHKLPASSAFTQQLSSN